MQLVIPRETQPGEDRVSATPETVKKLVRLGAEVVIESGAGTGAGISDADYEAAGASIGSDRIQDWLRLHEQSQSCHTASRREAT